jgi:trehalose 6-phosphate phosphatase
LLVATDFDGTLAPIHEDPQAPLASAENRRALRRLAAHPATVVAVISGRALADLRPRVGVEDIVYVGNHGLEIDRGGPPQAHPEARERVSLVREACRAVEEATTPGVRVEDKGLTATIHHREAEEATRRRVRRLLEDHVQATGDELRLSTGKANVELRPAVDWDKGSALRELADDAPPGWATVYLGDDDTDEDAFRALDEGLGIHVGRRSDTAAGYRIEDQAEVAGFLNALASEIHGEATWSANGAPRRPSAREATP